jgi:hypothetical protein
LTLLGIVSQAQHLVNQERDRERGLYFLKKLKRWTTCCSSQLSGNKIGNVLAINTQKLTTMVAKKTKLILFFI